MPKGQKKNVKPVGKIGRSNRPSRSRKRKYHPPGSKTVVDNDQSSVDAQVINEGPSTTTAPSHHVEDDQDQGPIDFDTSTSAKKLRPIDIPDVTGDFMECYVFMNTILMKQFIEKLSKCPECGEGLTLSHKANTKKGLAHFFKATCKSNICDWNDVLCSSKTVKSDTRGPKSYDINIRSCIAFREIGRGYQNMLSFMRVMNSPPPMDIKSYRKIYTKLRSAYTNSAKDSMVKAADEIKVDPGDDGIKDVRASFDGSWQRRGFSSMNGTVACISHGKVVDYDVLTKICHQCKYWMKKKSTAEFEQWKASHECSINHTGSAGSMEAVGVLTIFKRSIECNKLRYTKYLGDGDSKGYQGVVAADVYPGKAPEKEECVGHVQKKVGARLRSLKNTYKGVNLGDGKRLTGPGRLTEKAMNTLQNYYGMIIRNSSGNLYQMKKGVAAILYHCTKYINPDGTPNYEKRHKFCPPGVDSWCVFQKNKLNGENTYQPKINLPIAVSKVMEDIFSHKDLGADSLLVKCLHGLTQNPNEAFNQIIWKRAPKDVYVARQTLEIAVASAVLQYNDGSNGLLNVFAKLNLTCGHYTLLSSDKANKLRLSHCSYKSSLSCKQQRKQNRAIRKGWKDNVEANEEKSYSPGAF